MYCIPSKADENFVCRMEDILQVYQRPYDEKYPVICMDEATKQLLEDTRSTIPVKPGRVKRCDYEYK